MKRVVAWNLADNFIEHLSAFILDNFPERDYDFSNIACIFGGKRPALFLRRALSQKINKPFYPPAIFSIDEFVEYIVAGKAKAKKISSLEAAYMIYKIVSRHAGHLLKKREGFSEFLPWVREISAFIEQLDLEDIADECLLAIEKSAEIGYDVPPGINLLLQNMVKIRSLYHQSLDEDNFFSRGRLYLEASRQIKTKNLDEFREIIFCNFFYLHRTEMEIMQAMAAKEKGIFIFQGSAQDWSVLKKTSEELNLPIKPPDEQIKPPELTFYQGFDCHSQTVLSHHIFRKIKNKEDTVIVLPQAQSLIPLLSELSPSLNEYNISMGYPLARSSIYALFNALAKAQNSRKGEKLYAVDYLNLMRHPLVKNLKIAGDAAITRVIVHKIEELLQGVQESSIGGSLFIALGEIENERKIYLLAAQTLKGMDLDVEEAECRSVLLKLHELFFYIWEKNHTFFGFAENLEKLLTYLMQKSSLEKFPLNLKVMEKLTELVDEFKNLTFKDEQFSSSQIWEIFRQKIEFEKIAFIGSPLKGTQILGLFETRALAFENVIIVELNEGILPALKIYEPLIPREVMLSLGLNRLEKEEEIQRYQFSCLIAQAKFVHLVYAQNQEQQKSRFIEEIFWKIQKERRNLEAAQIWGVSFNLDTLSRESQVEKTEQVIAYLKEQKYSATRINTYLQCPLKFYYQYVLGLEEQEDLLDELMASQIGTFIHQLLEETFRQFKGRKPLIDKKFRDYFIAAMEEKFEREFTPRMKADSFLLKGIIRNRLLNFLNQENERPIKKIVCLEEQRSGSLNLGKYSLEFNYTVDRIDELSNGEIVILDYKTGGADLAPKKLKIIENMPLDRESIKDNIKSFQLPLYYYFTARDFPGRKINAEFYNLRTLARQSFISENDYPQREKVLEICLRSLAAIFDELFDLNTPFLPEKEERRCSFCAFRGFCA